MNTENDLMSQDKEIFGSFQDIWKFLGTFWIALFVLYWMKRQWTVWAYLFENNLFSCHKGCYSPHFTIVNLSLTAGTTKMKFMGTGIG